MTSRGGSNARGGSDTAPGGSTSEAGAPSAPAGGMPASGGAAAGGVPTVGDGGGGAGVTTAAGAPSGGATGAGGAGDGPGESDPGQILCGGAPCDLTSHYCCDSDPPECLLSADGAGACWGVNGTVYRCDEPADCDDGDTCVVMTNAPMSVGCGAAGLVLCKSNADCDLDVECITQGCNAGLGYPTTISTCGGSTWCTDHP